MQDRLAATLTLGAVAQLTMSPEQIVQQTAALVQTICSS